MAEPGAEGAAGRGDGAYRVLARKYRPDHFRDLIGQGAMVSTLTNAFRTGRIAHAYLLTGVRGVGKTTTARIIAKGLNCTGRGDGPTIDPCNDCPACIAIAKERHVDVIEMDAASNTSVNDVREIIEAVRYRPVEARYKVYIIDEVHMLSTNAFNALLKTLEEPPEHVVFLFATTELRKLPVTVLSRCQRFDLRRIEPERMQAHLAGIAEAEGVAVEPGALSLIVRAAEGSVRDALSLLDQAIAMGAGGGAGSGTVQADAVRRMLGQADRGATIDLFEAVMRGDAAGALAGLGALHDAGADAAAVIRDLAELTHWISMVKIAPATAEDPTLPPDERRRGADLAGRLSMRVLTRTWQMLLKAIEEVGRAPSARMAAEMAIIRLTHVSDLPSPADLVARLTGETAPAPIDAPPVGATAVDGAPVHGAPVDGAPVDGAPVGATPVGSVPVDGAPVHGAPVGRPPVDGAPVDGARVDGAPVDGAPVDGAPVDGAPVDDVRVGATPVDGVQDAATAVDGAPVDRDPASAVAPQRAGTASAAPAAALPDPAASPALSQAGSSAAPPTARIATSGGGVARSVVDTVALATSPPAIAPPAMAPPAMAPPAIAPPATAPPAIATPAMAPVIGRGAAAALVPETALSPAPTPIHEPAAPVAGADPAAWPDLAPLHAALNTAGELLLANDLAAYVRPVRLRDGLLEARLADGAPADLAGRLGAGLTHVTGTRWSVVLARGPGGATLGEIRQAEDERLRAEAVGHPLVAAVLAAFPGAEIAALRPLGAARAAAEALDAADRADDMGFGDGDDTLAAADAPLYEDDGGDDQD
ncbi:MAG: DNA polymerase III subunit gamma/tau [Pseudomonadota bacterium]